VSRLRWECGLILSVSRLLGGPLLESDARNIGHGLPVDEGHGTGCRYKAHVEPRRAQNGRSDSIIVLILFLRKKRGAAPETCRPDGAPDPNQEGVFIRFWLLMQFF
jgi:hypothetical protein